MVTTVQPTPKSAGGQRFGTGEVAGAAVGCFFGGAIIGSLLFFLVLPRFRRKRGGYANNTAYAPPRAQNEKGSATATGTVAIPQDSSAAIVENYLPPPAEDSMIKGELSKLRDKINGHVHSFYHSGPADGGSSVTTLMELVGSEGPLQSNAIPQRLADPASRSHLLRFAIAWIILARTEPECDSGNSFLPWQVVSCLHSMPTTRMEDRPRTAFLSKWRQLTSALLPPSYSQPNMAESDLRNDNIRKAVQLADSILQPYANSNDPERLRNLEEIMKRAARLAYLLFTHPSFWRFDWQSRGNGLAVFPSLLQLTNEAGMLHPQAVPFNQAEVVSI